MLKLKAFIIFSSSLGMSLLHHIYFVNLFRRGGHVLCVRQQAPGQTLGSELREKMFPVATGRNAGFMCPRIKPVQWERNADEPSSPGARRSSPGPSFSWAPQDRLPKRGLWNSSELEPRLSLISSVLVLTYVPSHGPGLCDYNFAAICLAAGHKIPCRRWPRNGVGCLASGAGCLHQEAASSPEKRNGVGDRRKVISAMKSWERERRRDKAEACKPRGTRRRYLGGREKAAKRGEAGQVFPQECARRKLEKPPQRPRSAHKPSSSEIHNTSVIGNRALNQQAKGINTSLDIRPEIYWVVG